MMHRNLLNARVLRAVSGLAALCLGAPAMAGTILVPQSYPTIQGAINAAVPGDVVLVAPGVYSGPGNRDLTFFGKAITLRSAGGASTCIIDAWDVTQSPHCGFYLQHNETPATVIDGFTVTGGYQFNGGGVYVHNGSPTFRNCTMTGNYVVCWGGGVYCESAGSPRFVNCRIVNNLADDDGGGFFSISGSPRLENCIITGNDANVGGGACVFGGQPQFINCRITGNDSLSYGGGLFLTGGRAVNCTIANNTSGHMGAAMYAYAGATVANSIIWGNSGGTASVSGNPGITFSIVQGGAAGAGNTSADPRFVNAAAGDFGIQAFSPAIDAGSNYEVPTGVVTDLSGGARFYSPAGPPIVDIGAFERQPVKTSITASRTR